MRRLIAGPWYGEFGWELMSWQAHLRKLSERYDEVVVCGPDGHAPLYTDFCDTYLSHIVPGVRDCWKVKVHEAELARAEKILTKYSGDRVKPTGLVSLAKQHFIKFGTAGDVLPSHGGIQILVHARGKFGKHPEHAWEPPSCDELVKHLLAAGFKVAAIGTQAFCPDGAQDCRDLDMEELMDLIASARLVIGPSSGPMHLASLCGTHQLIWTDKKRWAAIRGTNRERYEKIWNPLKTPCTVLDQYGWKPPVAAVMLALEEIAKKWKP